MNRAYSGIFNFSRMKAWVLITILVAMNTNHSDAATLSEMRALNASQKPGTLVVCNKLTEIHIKGQTEPVRIESLLSGVVLLNEGDRMVFDVTYTQKNVGWEGPFRTERYRLTTTLGKTHQKMAINPRTIELSLPYARSQEEKFLALLKENPISWEDYSVYRITSLPDYHILPRPENPTGAVMYCTNRNASQN